MFNFIIILNAAPHFFLATDEKQVLEVLSFYKDKVVRVVSGTDLKVKDVASNVYLTDHQTLLIPEVVQEDEDFIPQEIKEELSDELTIQEESV